MNRWWRMGRMNFRRMQHVAVVVVVVAHIPKIYSMIRFDELFRRWRRCTGMPLKYRRIGGDDIPHILTQNFHHVL